MEMKSKCIRIKKRKKVLTFGETSGKICLAFKKGTELQNGVVCDSLRSSKNLKKVVDKRNKLCYSKQAVAETTTKNLEN